ncbi:MAG TPA: FAD-binding protein [Rhodocyclaceae bacterium]|nr:FAD-binding protein [Rhodocyclaceae bacterium]
MTMTTELSCDVLVIGGGPAGCWAALTAREAGASVVLVDKGYVGTSGATAPTNSTVHYIVPDDATQRLGMVGSRVKEGQPFIDPSWVERVYDQTCANLDRLTEWGYEWPRNELGGEFRGNLRGPDYLQFLRRRLRKTGVKILDHSPALSLLQANDGVAGARGVSRAYGRHAAGTWDVRANAVVMATGGCAFRSGATGTFNLTGDGYLMAAQAGATFSGLEFTSNYAIAPATGALTKGIIYRSASFSDAQGQAVPRPQLFRKLADGERVFAVLDKAGDYLAEGYRQGQPNIFLYFNRMGSDPFRVPYEIRLFYEGTVRGTGGLLTSEQCETSVPGLFAAGDVVSKERLVGPAASGGGPASSWTNASGTWAGAAAARRAREVGARGAERVVHDVTDISGASTSKDTAAAEKDIPYREAFERVQAQVVPLDRNYFRTGEGLRAGLAELDALWATRHRIAPEAHADTPDGQVRAQVRLHELNAMIASARLFFTSALAREESCVLHRREDFPQSPASAPALPPYHIHVSGLDTLRQWRVPLAWTPAAPRTQPAAIAEVATA